MSKVVANEFLVQLSDAEFRDFCNKNLTGYHVFNVNEVGTIREVLCWEEAHRNKGIITMSFYDNRIIPENPELLKKWRDFMCKRFGEAYREKYPEES